MSRFFVPATSPEDWKSLLAEPDKHWREGYSAKLLADCWQGANDFPASVKRIFRNSEIRLFRDVKLLLAFPEYKVALPPRGGRPSQNDIFILAEGNNELVSITVEGKVAESFDRTIAEWKADDGKGKETRLTFLCALLQLDKEQIGHIRYQLLHRTASAIIEGKRFKAENALMLVHSFGHKRGEDNEGFADYCRFLELFGVRGKIDSLKFAKNLDGIDLFFGWVKENPTVAVR